MTRRAVPVLLVLTLLAAPLAGCLGTDPTGADPDAPQDGDAATFRPNLTLVDLLANLPREPTGTPTMLDDARELDASPRVLAVASAGTSGEGRSLLAVHLADGNASEKPTVQLTGSQHGNEPAGADASLLIARWLAQGVPEEVDPILDHVNVVVLVLANPDGRVAETRGNAAEVDVNRDHLSLLTPEGRAIHRLFNGVHPEVVLDLHEFGGSDAGDGDEGVIFEVAAPQNPLTHDAVLDASYRLERAVVENLTDTWGPGRVATYPPTTSSQDSSIHRNHYAVHGAASLLFESSVNLGLGDGYATRVHLHTFATHAVLQAVAGDPDAFLAARTASDEEGRTRDEAPTAYLFSCDGPGAEAAGLLEAHGFTVTSLVDEAQIASVHYDVGAPRSDFVAGTVVVPTAQPGWRSLSEQMEYTSGKDMHYTNAPKDEGMDAWRALDDLPRELSPVACAS